VTRTELDRIIDFVNSQLPVEKYECIEAEWCAEDRTLRLFIDRRDEKLPMSLSDCVAVNDLLIDLPDLDAMISGEYTLEVSSPGVERPLRRKAHFLEHLGETIEVKLVHKILDRRHGKGRLVAVDEDGKVTLETNRGSWSFPIDSLMTASVVYNWSQH